MRMRTLTLAVAIAVSASSWMALPPPPADAPRKHALLIGIDDYAAVSDLQGCANDVRLMESVLIGKFGFEPAGITTLLNSSATRAQILAKLAALAQAARRDDVVVVHYSGHGSRLRDSSSDELDGWDETLVAHDSRTNGVFDITDDEINTAVAKICQKTANVTFIFDSCHSGSITRGGAVTRRVDDDWRTPPAAGGSRAAEASNDFQTLDANYVLVMGSRPNELSNEAEFDGSRHGALTYHLTRELLKAGSTTTYRDVMDVVSAEVNGMFPSQHPDLEGLRSDSILFGAGTATTKAYLPVDPIDATHVRIAGGSVYGLTPGSTIGIYPPATKEFKPETRTAEAQITQVDAFQAEAQLTGNAVIESGSRAIVQKRRYADFRLPVHFDAGVAPAFVTAVQNGLREFPFIVPTSDGAVAKLMLVRRGEEVLLTSADIADLSPPVPLSDGNAATRVSNQIVQWAEWFMKRALDNPDGDLPVTMTITPASGSPRREFTSGDQLKVTITNGSDRNLYFTLVDFSSDGSSRVLYPKAGQRDFVAPGTVLTRRFQLTVPTGRAQVIDTFKLIATEEPIHSEAFNQDAVRNVDEMEPPQNSLARFLANAALGHRGAEDAPAEGWDSIQQTITIRANATRADSFMLHFGPGAVDPAGGTRGSLRGCDPAENYDPANPCYNVRPFAPQRDIVEVALPAGDTRSLRSVGSLWDKAYELRAATGALRAEPALEADLSDWPVEDPTSTRGGIQRTDKPGAASDALWSLRHIGAPKAWALMQANGRLDGEEGRDVVVGHPDTGYREHPETWNADPAKSATLAAEGYDFYAGDADAMDPLEAEGLLTNPGHGTKSSSVIISPKGKQWPSANAGEFVSGVAPGARLIPLRVHKSVVHFDSTRLAKSIFAAAGGDGSPLRKKASVVSISMGGLPSWALWKAVRFAEKQGVIVVAAAGNEVRFVVWPARFSETVAVAASNVECGIWGGSSGGPAVDITAPGESVWMAQTDKAGTYSVRMGQGTTFATATTAGVAALWLDHHRGPALDALKSAGQVTSAFRSALQATSWRPDSPPARKPDGVQCKPQAPWNAGALGPGIVNAAAALARPLPAPGAPRVAEADSVDELPLFRSLFAESVPPETVRARYASIFGATSDASRAAAEVFEAELMHHYATDEEVRGRLDIVTNTTGTVPREVYASVRKALLRLDLSTRMRTVLEANP